MCLAVRPQPPRCRIEDPGGLLLVVENPQVLFSPVVADLGGPPTTIAPSLRHPDADELRVGALRRLFRTKSTEDNATIYCLGNQDSPTLEQTIENPMENWKVNGNRLPPLP